MRAVICYEGYDNDFGQFLMPGSLKWEEGKGYPVVWEYQFDSPESLLGTATDFRRSEDGEITAEITGDKIVETLNKANADIGRSSILESSSTHYGLTIYGNEVVKQKYDASFYIIDNLSLKACAIANVPWNSI